MSEHFNETYKSLITLSVEGFKFCALANGGAAVALLAYLGNVASKGGATPDMRYAMAGFLVGLAACGFAIFFAYLTQLCLLNETAERSSGWFPHTWHLRASIALVFVSLASFSLGAWSAVVAFR